MGNLVTKFVLGIGRAIASKISGDIAHFLLIALSTACVVELLLERFF
jgi:hypothetical protein